jgi:hypothetical protein
MNRRIAARDQMGAVIDPLPDLGINPGAAPAASLPGRFMNDYSATRIGSNQRRRQPGKACAHDMDRHCDKTPGSARRRSRRM